LTALTTFAPATPTAAITGDRLIGRRVQRDADGLPDYFEDYDGDNALDAGETDSTKPDTDNDGLSDLLNLEMSNNVPVNDPAQARPSGPRCGIGARPLRVTGASSRGICRPWCVP
jgi:hypothetical protein